MDLARGAPRWGDWRGFAFPSRFPYAAVEAVLIALLAIQCARLVWAAAEPLGPLGNWTAGRLDGGAADAAVLARFDPFFRLASASGAAVVTSAPVKLFGVRLDQATGRGSAIIATPDGVQSSYAIGDEIMPGLVLKAVMLDHVSIERGGVIEQLYLDQSVAAPVAQPGMAPLSAPSATGAPSAAALRAAVSFAPRLESGVVTGFVVSPAGGGDVFRAIGFLPGDVVTTINGRTFRSVQEAGEALGGVAPNAIVQFGVERGGKITTINTRIGS
jgi:general secretion pathway protein C